MKLFHRLALFFQRLDEQRIFEDEKLRFQLPKGLDCRDLRREFEGELLITEMKVRRNDALTLYFIKRGQYAAAARLITGLTLI